MNVFSRHKRHLYLCLLITTLLFGTQTLKADRPDESEYSLPKRVEKANRITVAKLCEYYRITLHDDLQYTIYVFSTIKELKNTEDETFSLSDTNDDDDDDDDDDIDDDDDDVDVGDLCVIQQTKYDWDCPSNVHFREKSKYILFLTTTQSEKLYERAFAMWTTPLAYTKNNEAKVIELLTTKKTASTTDKDNAGEPKKGQKPTEDTPPNKETKKEAIEAPAQQREPAKAKK